MDLQLRGKRALVTGSTAGIGFATAAGLYKEGVSVVINGRTKERVEKAVGQIRGLGGDGQVSGIAADLSTTEGVAHLVEKLPEMDILVNNLGIFEPKPFEEIPDEDWLRFFETNVMSGVRLTRHYLPGMRRKNWGRIVFISSELEIELAGFQVLASRSDKVCEVLMNRQMLALLLVVPSLVVTCDADDNPGKKLRVVADNRFRSRSVSRHCFGSRHEEAVPGCT